MVNGDLNILKEPKPKDNKNSCIIAVTLAVTHWISGLGIGAEIN